MEAHHSQDIVRVSGEDLQIHVNVQISAVEIL